MSTNSTITVRTAENERLSIYCHWDGYIENNGAILLEYYNDHEKAKQLVKLGDLSSLRPNISPKQGQHHSFDKPLKDVCIFYGRDRGETGTEPKKLSNGQPIDAQEYNYYFDGENWYVSKSNRAPRKLLKDLFK